MAYRPKSDFLQVMAERGFLSDCTDFERLDHVLLRGVVPGYIGFDATAESLHVGSLIQVMMLRWLQKTGHKPIVLMGGGTTKVGDPSFRAEERPLLNESRISSNIAGIRKVFSKYVRFGDGRTDAVMPNNADWLDGLNYLDFLRDIGRHFSVNRMLSFESVKSRLDRTQTLSFLEFNYMILQAFDFLELNRRYGCRLQMGGSDQWGNIVNGVDLARRVDDAAVYGLTSPLLTTSDGRKMGKTAGGAVWLNKDMLSPSDFWQYWRSVPDADVGRFLLLFTEMPVNECRQLGELRDSDINLAKIKLATHVTELAHGTEAAKAAVTAMKFQNDYESMLLIGKKSFMNDQELVRSEFSTEGLPVVRLLVTSKLASTGKEARRLIAGGGVRLNGDRVADTKAYVSFDTLPVVLSVGGKRYARIFLSGE